MTNADDATVLGILAAVENLTTYDGHVTDSDADAKVISADLPYVVFYGFTDDPTPGDSLSGASGAHLTGFQLTFVGETREQARLCGERAAAALDRKLLTFPGSKKRFVRKTDVTQPVTRDDTWTRPGGAPLFSGLDRYAVLV